MCTVTYRTLAQRLGLHSSHLCVLVWASMCTASVSESWTVQDTSGILLLSRAVCYLWPCLVHIPSLLCSSLWGLYCNVCIAVNAGDGFRCCMYSPHKQCTASSLTEKASNVSFQSYSPLKQAKLPFGNTDENMHSRTCTHHLHVQWQALMDTSHGNIQTGMHDKGRSSWPPS